MERVGSRQRRQNRERMHRRSFGRKSTFGSARRGQLAHMPYSIVKSSQIRSNFSDLRNSRQILEEKASEIIEEADISGDGSLTKQEFIGYMHENDKRARIIFNELDTDNDGVLKITDIINHEELKHLDLRKCAQKS